MFFRSIKFRLTIWYLAVLIVLLAVFGLISYVLLSGSLYQNLDNTLRTRAADISSTGGAIQQSQLQSELGEIVQVYDTQGNFLGGSSVQLSTETIQAMINNALSTSNAVIAAATSGGQELHLYAIPVQVGIFRIPGELVVGRPTTEVAQAVNEFQNVIMIGGLFVLVLAAAGGYFLAIRALKPVDEMTKAARGIEESDLSRRLKVGSSDELGRLAVTINEMISRLEKAFVRQRQFTADASHELRTPLSVIEAEATLALGKTRSSEEYQQSLESITQEVTYMSSILEKLLMLARADAGKEQLNFDTINLKDLVSGLAPDIEMLANEKGLRFELGSVEDLSVSGDRVKLKQVLLNLLDNAIKYTPEGTISASLVRQENNAVISVIDTGIGISQEHLPRIFERFYRVDKARSRGEHGTGLGLAITKYIVEAHSGKIDVTSEVGKGTTFRVYLPLLPVEDTPDS